jgi:A/G-specific adenine glycosylase
MVSEVILQQTQVDRVQGYYQSFIQQFPTIESLARAPKAVVLTSWQGLGYNRRALNLHKAAGIIVDTYAGSMPKDYSALIALPGIGPYTATAIRAFAWNLPGVCIETNIRTVYIHHFFKRAQSVPDSSLLPIIAATLDKEHPRTWYAALMDYGSHLKATYGNTATKSAHYTKQSTFKGSHRQLRGHILRLTLTKPRTYEEIQSQTTHSPETLREILDALTKEGFLTYNGATYAPQI